MKAQNGRFLFCVVLLFLSLFIELTTVFSSDASEVTGGSESKNESIKIIEQKGTSIPTYDISRDRSRQTVVAQGTEKVYQGHPATVCLPDGKTIFAIWTLGHGGQNGPMAKSTDGGKSWIRLDDKLPKEYSSFSEVPCMYRLIDGAGKEFLWIFGAQPRMPRMLSRDKGEHWEIQPGLGVKCVLSFNSILPLNPNKQDGKYIGFFHDQISDDGVVQDREPLRKNFRLRVLCMQTSDGGFTWSSPRVVANLPGHKFCEPCAVWSPDGKEICCIMRENTGSNKPGTLRLRRSFMTVSSDHGKSWSDPEETSWELTGDRHVAFPLPQGRFLIVFRDVASGSSTFGHFIGWVGSYSDIRSKRPGDYRVKLLHSYAKNVWDCGYAGLSLLKNGDILAITYIKNEQGPSRNSVVGVRFNINEFDSINKSVKNTKLTNR